MLIAHIQDPDYPGANWKEIRETVRGVTEEDWESARRDLRESYRRILKLLDSTSEWGEAEIGGVLAVIAHTAYHLGEIRQALCILRTSTA